MSQNTENITSRIFDWVLRRPIQFAFGTFCTMLIMGMIFTGIISTLTSTMPSNESMMILMLLVFIFWIGWLVRKLPQQNMTRSAFISTYSAINITMGICGTAFFVTVLMMTPSLMRAYAFGTPAPSFIFTSIMIAIGALYLIGLYITNLYTQFSRTRTMGTSRIAAILSLPFGYALLTPASYLLHENNDNTTNIPGATWYRRATTWIVRTPYMALCLFIILITSPVLLTGIPTDNVLLSWIGLALFGIWRQIRGNEKTRYDMHHIYPIVAIILNVISIATLIYIIA